LLGAGESGKSTVFKQMRVLFGDPLGPAEALTWVEAIKLNIITGMRTMCYELIGTDHWPELQAQLSETEIAAIRQMLSDTIALESKTEMFDALFAQRVHDMWNTAVMQQTFECRAAFQLVDSVAYFFNKVKQIVDPSYVPTTQDVLQARVRTTGIVEQSFTVDHNTFLIMDVGGQRNERRKWIHCFDNVTAILFVAAMSEYDQVLYEDHDTNRMDEAVNLFDEVVNSKWFANTAVILFLNKKDLFQDKIKKVPLTVWAPEYDGQHTFEEAADFVKDEFLNRRQSSREIYCHYTTATDSDNVKNVFMAISDIVVRQSLEEGGFLA
jgi:G-protein alpha subunit